MCWSKCCMQTMSTVVVLIKIGSMVAMNKFTFFCACITTEMKLCNLIIHFFDCMVHWYVHNCICQIHIWRLPPKLPAPASVSVQETSADSIKVSWTPAPTASSVSVTYFINASSPTYQTVRRSVTDPDREVFLSGLHPFAEYYITVQASNLGGLSEPTGRNATTLTAGAYFYHTA